LSLAPDYQPSPYWLDDVSLPADAPGPLPADVDVLVVGAGYTGLSAAAETARAGRSTLVLDSGPIGGGCSSRNGGQVAFSIKPELEDLTRRHGARVAQGIYREATEAIAELEAFAATPEGACDYRRVGGFYGAHTARHFTALARAAESQPRGFEVPIRVVPRGEQAAAIGSDFYHGGLVYPDDAAVHPARLVVALHARAVRAGAHVRGHAAVTALERTAAGFVARTAAGTVRARDVLIATNGYTGALSPWARRRIVPIGSYIIATEALDPTLVERLIPRGRNLGDTRRVVVYVRPSPDGRRLLFGGRAAAGELDVTRCVPRLRRMMATVFPELANVAVSRAWMGFVGFTFDTLPHLGVHDGVRYCMGYCGQGVPLATYYGRRAGLALVGDAAGRTALDGLPFATRPFYTGTPWFMPAAIAGYRLRDALGW
jgi:glycine/D-amino acid oxidase-like deaminating enzyme